LINKCNTIDVGTPIVRVSEKFDSLKAIGIAAQYFPRYVQAELTQHAVDVVLFSCVIQGSGRHVMGEEAFEVGPGSVGLTHYGQQHDIVTSGEGVEMINLYLDLKHHPLPTLPAALQPALSALLSPHPGLVNLLNRRVHVVIDDVNRMADPLRVMLREITDRRAGYEAVVRAMLVVFLIEFCRVAHDDGYQPILSSDAKQTPWLETIRQRLDTRFSEPLTLEDLAAQAAVSPEHLCRRFKAYAGRSPMAYLSARRVQDAMWRLRTTSDPVLEVALASGFGDLSHFNRTFKTAVGITPSAYRRGGSLAGCE